jgi:glycosyltransferase involved in cell wall biosynthesis
MKNLSIIIPVYNEQERIQPTIEEFNEVLTQLKRPFEILVVDDGSTDETAALIKTLAEKIPSLSLIPSVGNFGKGHAVRRGMLVATGEIRLFADADGSTPAHEIIRFIEPLDNNQADVVIGTRYHHDSIIDKSQPNYRVVWSRFANRVVQKVLLPGIADPNCGFKAFDGMIAQQLFEKCQTNEWSFDLEILALARKSNFRLSEIPVRWKNDERSKGRITDLPAEIRNLFRIKRRMKHFA